MRRSLLTAMIGCVAISVSACASTGFTSTWRNPDAQSMRAAGTKVAALVMSRQEATRRAAEDALARAITAQGARGIPLYMVSPDAANEAATRAALEKQGFSAVVVMRPIGSQQRVTATPTMYAGPMYGGFWGGYYGYGWGSPWGATAIRTDTIVQVETLVYSLAQNTLVWGGQSQTTNPANVEGFVHEVADAAARELRKAGLIGPS